MRKFICTLLIFLFASSNLLVSSPAYAADFGQAPLKTIVFMTKDENGDILAIDNEGSVAKFDYIKWSVMHRGSFNFSYPYAQFDPISNTLLIGNSKLYNFSAKKWTDVPSIPPDNEMRMAKLFMRKGVLYAFGVTPARKYPDPAYPLLYKYENAKWVEVLRDETKNLGETTYSAFPQGRYNYKLDGVGIHSYYTSQRYSFVDKKLVAFHSTGLFNQYIDPLYAVSNYRSQVVYYKPDENMRGTPIENSSVTGIQGEIDESIPFSFIYGEVGRLWGGDDKGSVSSIVTGLDFIPFTITPDRYGNYMIGGERGRVVVKTPTGSLTTETNIYSDFFLGDIKQAANEARDAANGAKEASERAEQAAREGSQNASLAKDYAYNSWQETLKLGTKIDSVESNLSNKLSQTENNIKNAFDSRLSQTENNLRNDISNLNTDLSKKLATINTSITNMQNFVAPTLTKVSGYNKATATKDSSFKVSLDYTGANEYRYNIDGSGWSSWTSLDSHDNQGYFTVGGIGGKGIHTVMVEIRQATTANDPATGAPVTTYSPVAKGKQTFFKL